jgi:hypothetical protein
MPTQKHLHTNYIPTTSHKYRKRLRYLDNRLNGRCFAEFDADPLSQLDRNSIGEIPVVMKQLENDGWGTEIALGWLIWESKLNSIDWIADQLLGAMKDTQRKNLAEIPVRITDTGKLAVLCDSENNVYWITIDRALVSFIDYVSRLIHIEAFRPKRNEYLFDPPTHEDVVRLLKLAGSYYHRGEWSASIRPISRMHFRHMLNPNLTIARLGSLLFILAHEYGHIALGHLNEIHRLVSGIAPQGALGKEIMADQYAMSITLSTIAKLWPEDEHRAHCEIGIFLYLMELNLAEVVIQIKTQGNPKELENYCISHSTGFARLMRLLESHNEQLSHTTKLLLLDYLDIGDSLADALRRLEI